MYKKLFIGLVILAALVVFLWYTKYESIQKLRIVYISDTKPAANQSNIKPDDGKILDKLKKDPKTEIYKYITLPLDYKYGSNSIPLAIAALLSSGDLLELGMGMFSTPLLHKISADYDRHLVSVDTEISWVNKFIGYNSTGNHEIIYLDNYEKLHKFGQEKKWGMVLVDHLSGETRYQDVIRFANNSQIVVIHDAEKSAEYYYKLSATKVRDYFKHACKYSVYDNTKVSYISTLLLSNYVDTTSFKKIFDDIKTDYGHVSCNLEMK